MAPVIPSAPRIALVEVEPAPRRSCRAPYRRVSGAGYRLWSGIHGVRNRPAGASARRARPRLASLYTGDVAAKRVRLFVSGDVQGVGFRWYCREQAVGGGLSGYVRNLPDGRVEAAFEGSADAVDRVVEWCRRGPPGANVTSVDLEEEPVVGEQDFRITH